MTQTVYGIHNPSFSTRDPYPDLTLTLTLTPDPDGDTVEGTQRKVGKCIPVVYLQRVLAGVVALWNIQSVHPSWVAPNG